ncbi:vWA domain-containing protein [Halodesulfovibrio marinisediminis]|uniref:DsrE/DsrF-like family protein n=1 Tax=Halodesulfovibrio marinisediminis DSM 17456 TaxID=1121457 RepID=A0A1N6EWS3_9BACT|nr:hypothetical protein [Halodesulfovibrio marinisediminis]SIN87401.1 hypothetical protein SAMN02745161_0955 [Halodesulfovibrio marinisediminis DSM 17456]
MRQTTLIWGAFVALLLILSITAVQYETRKNSDTIYVEQTEPQQVTLILNTAAPDKVETTFSLARKLYDRGVDTTVLLEGSGVTLIRTTLATSTRYKGAIAICPHCMAKFNIRKSELPDGAYMAPEELTYSIHAGDKLRPRFE